MKPTGIEVNYGKINLPLLQSWQRMNPDDDGPFWALNLMKYRETAAYSDGRTDRVSGLEADDRYAPTGPLAAVGAKLVFLAVVERVLVGDGAEWDRIAVVRYSTHKSFLEMQRRDDFKTAHVHKEAGMEFTIVLSCLPVGNVNPPEKRDSLGELTVTGSEADEAQVGAGGVEFSVEGVIIGDERTWRSVSRRAAASQREYSENSSAPVVDPARYVMLLRPNFDYLIESVLQPGSVPDHRGGAAIDS